MKRFLTLFILSSTLSLFAQNNITEETESLLNYLHSLKDSNKILFGHHLSNVERQTGRNWNKASDPTFSDVYEVTGSMPAVFSYDFGRGISKSTNHCKAVFLWGGIVTISWHADNPINGGNVKDKTGNPMGDLSIEGTTANTEWKAQLDLVAEELNGLTVNGVKVPVIFRPFHEHTGSWFWWGRGNCTEAEFVAGWRYTVDYLRAKGVNNMLMAYSPSKPASDQENKNYTQATYPGDDYVDILGFDQYDDSNLNLIRDAQYMVEMAEDHGKVAAITEFGHRNGLNNNNNTIADWFSVNLDPVHADPVASKVAYALTWMNTGEDDYWVPLANDKQHDDFLSYTNKSYCILLNDLDEDVYNIKSDPNSQNLIQNPTIASNTDPFTDAGGGTISFSNETHTADSSGSIKLDADGGFNSRAQQILTGVSAGTYTVSFWAKGTAGNKVRPALYAGTGILGEIVTLQTSDWELIEETFTFTHSGNVIIRSYNRTPSSTILLDDISFSDSNTASLAKNELKLFSLYPTMSSDFITVSAQNEFEIQKAEIYSISGQKIKQPKVIGSKSKLNISDLQNGIYLLKAYSNSKSSVSKFIKI